MMENFDLLNYMNDDSLIATLGIEPVPVSDDSYAKLLGTDANSYADLLPPSTHQLGNCNSLTGSDTTYYTIDTEPQGISSGDSVVSQPASLPVEISATTPFLVTSAATQNSPPTWNIDMPDASFIIVSSAEDESDTPVSIAIQDSNIAIQNPTPTPTIPESIRQSQQLNNSPTEAKVEASEKTVRKPRRRRPRKEKVYEITEKLEDPVQEKKRQNAINAKKNRDKKKNMLRELGEKVSAVTKERDELLKEVEQLKVREQALRQQLQAKYGVRLPVF